ncbi:Flp family type IVb pilin [Thaumasiovibrio sp. DFM-14]|uniref:Flp family type IVb pilin n=1 Tax=Thaumasiovibrio sp. DFM-14 TaxID=3384792 RepID=UPI0039A38F30
MLSLKQKITAFLKDEEGLTTVEYAVAGALIVGGLAVAFENLGNAVENEIDELRTTIE